MNAGDLFWVDYPWGRGSAQSGSRPAVILQDETYGQRSPLILTIPLTTQAATLRYPAVVGVPTTPLNGLASPSYALVFQIVAAERLWIQNQIGYLERSVLDEIYAALDRLTGRVIPGAP